MHHWPSNPNENMSKNKKPLSVWVDKETEGKDRCDFLRKHLIPETDLNISNFREYVSLRTELLINELKNKLI